MTEALPMDIVTEILLLLPAKPLLRFKSVCKSWYDLINGPDFLNRHLRRSLTTQSNLRFVFRTPVLKLGDFDTFDDPIELDYPFKRTDHGGAAIIGSCHGLLCLWNYDYFNFIVFLYNPTTRTYKILPFLPRPSHVVHLHHTFIYGFGYDCVFDDYKFVRILQCCRQSSDVVLYSEVMVYSLRNDSWSRVLDDAPCFSCRKGVGALVNGALHWVIDTELDHEPLPIVSFNLSTHSFSEVPVPEIDMFLYVYMHVGVLDGCLCILLNYLDESEIWVMREYGVVESWTKLFRVRKPRGVDVLESPVAFSKDRKRLFLRLCLYRVTTLDLETMVIEDVEVFNNPSRHFDAHVCVENLLMLDDYDEFVGGDQQQGESTGRRRRRRRRRRRGRRNKRNTENSDN